MPKLKAKQINGVGQSLGAVITTDGSGNTIWAEPALGTPIDGDLSISYYPGGPNPAVPLFTSTKIVDAVDSINEVLGLFMPYPPAAYSNTIYTLSTANTTALFASGYATNGNSNTPAAGTSGTRVTVSSVSSTTSVDFGDGMNGSISLYKNTALVPSTTLTFTSTLGDTLAGVFVISNEKWGGTSPSGGSAPNGFYQTFESKINALTVSAGYNTIQGKHTVSGNSATLTVTYDPMTTNPGVSGVTVAEGIKNSTQISGLTCYTAGSTFTVGASITTLSGQMYKNGTILDITGPGSTVNFSAGQGGLPAILPTYYASFAMAGQVFTVGSGQATRTGHIGVDAYNANGSGSASNATNLIVLSTTATLEPTISGPATTNRVYLTASNKNTDTPSTLSYSAWVSSQDLSAAGYTHEAVVVANTIYQDTTNYSTGYLPAGNPNYSSKTSTQYITYMFAVASKSNLTVNVTGSYAGCWVGMPGLSDNSGFSPNAVSGTWWDAFQLYNGSGYPGRSGQTAGCASGTVMSGGSGTFTITFGAGNSSNSTGNMVFIRFKLTSGQSISALSLS